MVSFITQWGSFGNGNGQFNRPAGIAIDPEDNLIYVSDTVNNQIQVFDSDGNFITKWGSFGLGNGQFNRPDGIYFEPSEKSIYVAIERIIEFRFSITREPFLRNGHSQIANPAAD